eukprot:COSAG05_NODE_498_length_9248_cov_20.530003_6_plen_49_part_00
MGLSPVWAGEEARRLRRACAGRARARPPADIAARGASVIMQWHHSTLL